MAAWAAIIVAVALALFPSLSHSRKPPVPPSLHSQIIQVRFAVGVYHLLGDQNSAERSLPSGGGGSRALAVLAVGRGQWRGPAQALADLEQISAEDVQAAEELDLLKASYTGREVDGVRLRQAWGWVGELAATQSLPDTDVRRIAILRPALRAAQVGLFGMLAAVVGLVAGLMLSALALVRWRAGALRSAERPADGDGSCLIVFAVYLWAFAGFSVLVHVLIAEPSLVLTWAFLPLAAVVLWLPVRARRWTWPDLRQALGLHRGQGVFAEVSAGLLGYVAGLPLIALGLLLTGWLTQWFPAEHPVTNELIARATTPGGIVAIFALAAGFAPVVEETMFRGLLFHHLRRHGISIAVLGSSLIFAAIHPQGIAGIPALTAIAVVFALIRTWRGSLYASMAAHALHNGLLVLVLVLVMG